MCFALELLLTCGLREANFAGTFVLAELGAGCLIGIYPVQKATADTLPRANLSCIEGNLHF